MEEHALISTNALPTLTAVTSMRCVVILWDLTRANVKQDSQEMETPALKTPFTEVFHSGATGVAAAVHVEAEFVIAIVIATIPGPKMAEETVVDQRQRQGDVTCTLAQFMDVIQAGEFGPDAA